MNLKQRAALILKNLHKMYPRAECTLDFAEPWHLLAGAILASQCTDARVNKITPGLFARYPDLASLAAAEFSEVEALIRSCGLFRGKAKALIGMARMIMAEYAGQIPAERSALIRLPGVGRKIANLILGDYFGIPALVVDTHCGRISRLLGLTDNTSPLAVEKDLEKIIAREEWIAYGHLMVNHGREICLARRPLCSECDLNDLCDHGRKLRDKGIGNAGKE